MKQPEDTKTIDLIEAQKAEKKRAQNAARQAKYRERAKGRGQTPTAIMLDSQIDSHLQILCVQHGCDRRTMIQALIRTAWEDLADSMTNEEWTELRNDTFKARTRKHRVYRDTVTE